jgi:phage gp36-like protein
VFSYCTVAQLLAFALPAEAVQNLSNLQLQAECDAASTLADSYLRGRYALPLISFDIELSMQVAYIAAYNILASRGYNPEAGADSIYRDRWVAAVEWFKGVQRQAIHPNVQPSPTGDPVLTFPQVNTAQERGWGYDGSNGGRGVW